MKWWVIIPAAALVTVGVLASLAFRGAVRENPSGRTKAQPPRPTLYCEFYNFTHNATVVSFNFAVARDDAKALTFAELFVVEPDGSKTDYANEAPLWSLGSDDGTPIITSPDAATRIVLYGLKPSTAGVFWTEAGIRSNTYRNLEGKCRQAHLDRLSKM